MYEVVVAVLIFVVLGPRDQTECGFAFTHTDDALHNFAEEQSSAFFKQLAQTIGGPYNGSVDGNILVGHQLTCLCHNAEHSFRVGAQIRHTVRILVHQLFAGRIEQTLTGVIGSRKAENVVGMLHGTVTVLVAAGSDHHFQHIVIVPVVFTDTVIDVVKAVVFIQLLVEHQNPGGVVVDYRDIAGGKVNVPQQFKVFPAALVPPRLGQVDIGQVVHTDGIAGLCQVGGGGDVGHDSVIFPGTGGNILLGQGFGYALCLCHLDVVGFFQIQVSFKYGVVDGVPGGFFHPNVISHPVLTVGIVFIGSQEHEGGAFKIQSGNVGHQLGFFRFGFYDCGGIGHNGGGFCRIAGTCQQCGCCHQKSQQQSNDRMSFHNFLRNGFSCLL